MAATIYEYNLPDKLSLTGDSSANFRRFKQQLQIYLVASGLDKAKDERKIAILLNVVGEEGLQIYNNFSLKGDGAAIINTRR